MIIRIVRSQWVVSRKDLEEAVETLGLQAAKLTTENERHILEFDPNLELLAEVKPGSAGGGR